MTPAARSQASRPLPGGEEPLVSVVIPTFNRARLLPRAIESVLGQSHSHWELIVVDDGSDDGTEVLMASFGDDRIRFHREPANQGAPTARNIGMALARGEFVALLDSDDEWYPSKVATQVEAFRRRPDIQAVICGRAVIDRRGRRVEHVPSARDSSFDDILTFDHGGFGTSTLMIRRTVFVSGFDFDVELAAFQEWDLLLRISREHAIGILPEVLVLQHYEDHDIGHIANPNSQLKALLQIQRKYAPLLQERPRTRARHHFKTARMQARLGDVSGVRRELAHSLLAWPWALRRWLLLVASLGGRRVFFTFYRAYSALSSAKRPE